jgi:hypothetical protein
VTRFALLCAALTLTGCDGSSLGGAAIAVMVAVAAGCRGYQAS